MIFAPERELLTDNSIHTLRNATVNDTTLIPVLVHLMIAANNGDISAAATLDEHAKVPGRQSLIDICRNAVGKNIPRIATPPLPAEVKRTGRFMNRCTVCDRPAIPGDSVCYTHNN